MPATVDTSPEKTYWNREADLFDLYSKYYDALVPSVGPASTEEGELLRAISNLTYDHYNNGSCNARTDMASELVRLSEEHLSEKATDLAEMMYYNLRAVERKDYVSYFEDEHNSKQQARFERALVKVADEIVSTVFTRLQMGALSPKEGLEEGVFTSK
jgi:hypothetical protein